MKLKIITDCSGIDAPLEALKQMKINFDYLSGSEINDKAREFITLNNNPKILYSDIKNKPDFNLLPRADIYFAGFPCQSFSIANIKRKNPNILNTSQSNIFFYCLKSIKINKPKIFVLENVKGLISGKMKPIFNTILEELKKLPYHIHYKVLNTKNFGIPQNRERIYIVGISNNIYKTSFAFPDPVKSKHLKKFLHDPENISKYSVDLPKKAIERLKNFNKNIESSVDLTYLLHSNEQFWSPSRINYDKISCLIRSSRGIYLPNRERLLTEKEMFSLQGFESNKLIYPNFSLSEIRKLTGNTMSVNVLKEIIKKLIFYL